MDSVGTAGSDIMVPAGRGRGEVMSHAGSGHGLRHIWDWGK